MNPAKTLFLLSALCCVTVRTAAAFDTDSYRAFVDANKQVSSTALLDRHAPKSTYYLGRSVPLGTKVAYLDSVKDSLNLTSAELQLLDRHDFVVTERLSYSSFGEALHKVYGWDLPVFVSTDAILHALHMSYDKILIDLEQGLLIPSLDTLLSGIHAALPDAVTQLQDTTGMRKSINDVDLYVTVARSLLRDTVVQPMFASPVSAAAIMEAIDAKKLQNMQLFTSTPRMLDFSQFTVRGHYADLSLSGSKLKGMRLSTYFKAMMWLGRMDFLLTSPPGGQLSPEETRRMTIDAALLNHLIDKAGVRAQMSRIDELLSFLVGESDNLTPAEFAKAIAAVKITSPCQLLVDSTYNKLQAALQSDSTAAQRILSDIFIADPHATKPDILPISYKLMGQRFIIDSYIFSNVVYDRIIHNNQKVWRPMPDVLDAMFALGNDDALPLVASQVEQYHYGPQLAAMRYLVDSQGAAFWNSSLYNCLLHALRSLSSTASAPALPVFMKTTAWQQEKLNTQCASWTQLRHDNLLYAKQSLTWSTMCSFPHGYVEPYPDFYDRIGKYATKASSHFGSTNASNGPAISLYFQRLSATMDTLKAIAEKELSGQPTTGAEREFLEKTLFKESGSGAPPFSGWYAGLFYRMHDAAKQDFVVADVHTQPTDQFGAMVGRVLHVGVGKVNLGVFFAPSPSAENQLMAFVGPVFSYHEKITSNFRRLTDQDWTTIVRDSTPARPDWVNLYLASRGGAALPKGRSLDGVEYTSSTLQPLSSANHARGLRIAGKRVPSAILYSVPEAGPLWVRIVNSAGRQVFGRAVHAKRAGEGSVTIPAGAIPSGAYVAVLKWKTGTVTEPFVVAR